MFHHVRLIITCLMVQVSCPYELWFTSYVTFTMDTSLAYCRHVILCNTYFFHGDPKFQSEMHISLQELRYGLICILWLLLLSGLWAVIPMWVDLIGYGPLSYVAVPPSSLW